MPRLQTEFFKSGDAMAIRTNAADVGDFFNSVATVLAELIERDAYKNDWEFQLGYWLPQITEIACKLKGYKADVDEQRVITAGDFAADESARVASLADTKKAELVAAG